MPQGIALLAFYSLGLGLPFLAAAVFTDSLMLRLRGLRRLGRNLQLGAGAIVAGMGVAMLTGELTSFSYWLLDPEGKFVRVIAGDVSRDKLAERLHHRMNKTVWPATYNNFGLRWNFANRCYRRGARHHDGGWCRADRDEGPATI